MNRRRFFGRLAAFAAVVAGAVTLKPRAVWPRRRVGLGMLTPETHWRRQYEKREFIHVYCDGEDVTNRCFLSDDREQYVALYRNGPDGRPYVILDVRHPKYGEVATELRTGDVRYVMERITAQEADRWKGLIG